MGISYRILPVSYTHLDVYKRQPKRNVITRALGSEEVVHADIFELELLDNDILLLCTDGLTTHVSDDRILEIINEYGPSQSVKKLIQQANDNGGTDNITIIIVDNMIRGETVSYTHLNITEIQYKILENGSKYLKAGGELVYSTCTTNKEENYELIDRFLNNNKGFTLSDISDNIHEDFKTAKNGYLEIYPHLHGMDGFFIAKIKGI